MSSRLSPAFVPCWSALGGALIVMLQNDPTMAAIALCGAPISLIVSRYNIRKMREYEKKNQEFASKNVSFNQEIFQHMQTIKAFGLVETFIQRYENRQKEAVRLQLDREQIQQRGSIATSLVGQSHRLRLLRVRHLPPVARGHHLRLHDHAGGHGGFPAGLLQLRGEFGSQRHPRLHQCRADYGSHRPAPGGVGGVPKSPAYSLPGSKAGRFRENGKMSPPGIPGTRPSTPAPTSWQARGRSSAWWAPLDWARLPL